MQVGFEAKRFFTNYTGLGNYARFVVGALSEFIPESQYILYSPKVVQHPEVNDIVSRSNVSVVSPTGGYKLLKGLWRSRGVSNHSTVSSLNVFHGLSQELPAGLPAGVRKIVTVHDLIYIRFPQFYKPIDVAIYKAKVKAACKMADKIIAISEQTADDLVHYLKVDRSRIDVVYQGCHPIFKRITSVEERQAVKAKYNLPEQYILSVGTIEIRKNVKLLVQALARMPEGDRIPVVIVGKATPYKEEVVQCARENNVLDKIHFLHNASFQDFPALYQQAKIFVYPSLFEGFGIPLVEAIESHIPVITSLGSCFREAAGPSALYADPTDADDLSAKLTTVLRDEAKAREIVAASLDYIQQFQPAVIARDLNAVYTNVTS